jgi:plastocyanin
MFFVLISMNLVIADGFFQYYDSDIFTAMKIFSPAEETFEVETFEVKGKVGKEVEVFITKEGFSPEKIEVNFGDEIIWKNQRNLQALVLGTRAISFVVSGVISPGKEFVWKANKTGKHVYVDGIIIGQVGEIIVH